MSAGAHVAVHAAAEQRRKQREEEENMTRYTNQELEGSWEFKIIRSATGAFGKPQTLAQVLEQERMGDWELMKKFDNNRIRLRRPASARAQDHTRPRGYDPYRTSFGISEGALGLWVVLGIFAAVGLGLLMIWLAGGFS